MQTIEKLQVLGGECRVSNDAGVILYTVLGPCVSASIYDPVAGVGGMNHFMLPTDVKFDCEPSGQYGDQAMEMLVNELCKMGADPSRLQAKLYGGRETHHRGRDIGEENASMAHAFLSDSRIPIVDEDTGGNSVRWVNFHPVSGRLHLKCTPQPSDFLSRIR